jgi:hypothetical protein
VNCRQARGLIPLYLEKGLEGRLREALAEHLVACQACARAFKFHRTVSSEPLLSEEELRRAPAGLREQIGLCVECMERPGRKVCPRIRYKLRLAPPPPPDVGS